MGVRQIAVGVVGIRQALLRSTHLQTTSIAIFCTAVLKTKYAAYRDESGFVATNQGPTVLLEPAKEGKICVELTPRSDAGEASLLSRTPHPCRPTRGALALNPDHPNNACPRGDAKTSSPSLL